MAVAGLMHSAAAPPASEVSSWSNRRAADCSSPHCVGEGVGVGGSRRVRAIITCARYVS